MFLTISKLHYMHVVQCCQPKLSSFSTQKYVMPFLTGSMCKSKNYTRRKRDGGGSRGVCGNGDRCNQVGADRGKHQGDDNGGRSQVGCD